MKTKYLKIVYLVLIPLLFALNSCGDPVNVDNGSNSISVFPNPVSTNGSIFYKINNILTLNKELTLTIVIVDRYGREMIKLVENKKIQVGSDKISFDGSHLPAGVYSCIADFAGTILITEFTVVR
jgi:hypothetical protein